MRLLSVFVVAAVLASGCAHNAPTTTPAAPDPVLHAATEAGATVLAAHAAELAYYASGNSHISATDQAAVQKIFVNTEQAIQTATGAYTAAKTAANKQALVAAIVSGVNALVAQFAHMTDAQMSMYTAWVNSAVTLIDLAIGATS